MSTSSSRPSEQRPGPSKPDFWAEVLPGESSPSDPETEYFAPPASSPTWSILGLRFDRRVVEVIVVTTLLITVDYYHRFFAQKAWDRLALFLLIPLIWVVFIWHESPGRYGLQWGDRQWGLKVTGGAMTILAVVLYFVARRPEFVQYYGGRIQPLLGLLVENAADLFGWEFMFRGFLLFVFARRYGPEAILLQAVPFAIAHLSKPELETMTTIFGGAAFGYIAWRSRSMLYPFLIHWFMQCWVIWIAGGGLGR